MKVNAEGSAGQVYSYGRDSPDSALQTGFTGYQGRLCKLTSFSNNSRKLFFSLLVDTKHKIKYSINILPQPDFASNSLVDFPLGLYGSRF